MPTNEEAYQALSDLHEALDNAFREASDIGEREEIYALNRAVNEELTALNRLSMQQRSAAYRALTPSIARVNARLQKLKRDIDQIVTGVGTAQEVIKALEKVLAFV